MKRWGFTEQQIAFARQQACEWQANPLLCAAPRFTPTPISRAIFRIPLSPLRRACWIACSTDSSTLGLPSFIPFNLALASPALILSRMMDRQTLRRLRASGTWLCLPGSLCRCLADADTGQFRECAALPGKTGGMGDKKLGCYEFTGFGPTRKSSMPTGRLELPRGFPHHPLKMACLPVPPRRRGGVCKIYRDAPIVQGIEGWCRRRGREIRQRWGRFRRIGVRRA